MAASSTLVERSAVTTPGLSHVSVFGLDVESTLPLRAVAAGAHATEHRLSLRHTERAKLEARWPGEGTLSLIDRRTPSGRLVMSIDAHPVAGYRVAAPGFGAHIVSPDGTSLLSAIPAISSWRWQRLLFAQVLPLASALQGLEPLHASGVERAGRVIAVIATSGTGKSSLAAHLVSRGARYVADDVLTLQATDTGPVAHPGPATASVHRSELRSLGAGRRRVGTVIGRSDKLQLAIEPVARPLPLAAIYFVQRESTIARFAIEGERAADPRLLLASGFISYLTAPEFLLGHLEACATIAQRTKMFRVSVPPNVGAREVAETLERHAEVDT